MHSAHKSQVALCAGVDLVLDTLITTRHHTPQSCARTVFLGLGSLALSLSFLRSRLSFGLWLYLVFALLGSHTSLMSALFFFYLVPRRLWRRRRSEVACWGGGRVLNTSPPLPQQLSLALGGVQPPEAGELALALGGVTTPGPAVGTKHMTTLGSSRLPIQGARMNVSDRSLPNLDGRNRKATCHTHAKRF